MVTKIPSTGDIVYGSTGLPIGMVSELSIESNREGFETINLKAVNHKSMPQKPIIQGVAAIFGIPTAKSPYRGTIIGNVRIKYRNNDYARVFIRDPYRIRKFVLVQDGAFCTHGPEEASTERTTPRKKQ